MNELYYLRQMLMGGGTVWLQAGLMICLFFIMAFRPERVRFPTLFRWSCTLLVLSLIVPPLLEFGVGHFIGPMSRSTRFSSADGGQWLMVLPSLSGIVLFALSLMSGFAAVSVVPQQDRQSTPERREPRNHPLD